MIMAIDKDLGFPTEHAHTATDKLRQPIQDCLNDFDLSVVLTALIQVFYWTLYDAGIGEKQVKAWTKKFMKLAGKSSKQSVNVALRTISDPVNDLVVNGKISSLAIAFSLATAITSILRQFPAVTDAMADEFMATLIAHIDIAQNAE